MAQNLNSLDPYLHGHGHRALHHLDARIKFVVAIAFILTTSLTPFGAWPVYILLFSLAFSLVLISEIGILRVYRRSALALPFILAALPLIFTVRGEPITQVSIGFVNLVISSTGIERFISIALKSWISVQIAVLLAATTRLPDLLFAMRSLHIPRLMVAVTGLMWRYIFLMVEEANRLLRARLSRSGADSHASRNIGGTLTWRAKVAGNMAGSLMVRSFERSDRVYSAMLSRGYDGEIRSLHEPAITAKDWRILIIAILLLAGIMALGLLLGA